MGGKRKRKVFTGATKSEVAKRLADAREAREKGRPLSASRKRLGEYLTEWLAGHAPAVRESSAVRYAELYRMSPALAD